MAVRAVGLPVGLFADVAPKVVTGWRARAAVESPSHLRDHPQPTRLVLLSALLFEREREITDALVELLISTVHRIDARAERKVVKEFVKDFRRVTGKDTLLRHIAEASLEAPDEHGAQGHLPRRRRGGDAARPGRRVPGRWHRVPAQQATACSSPPTPTTTGGA